MPAEVHYEHASSAYIASSATHLPCFCQQVAAFADYKPGGGGGGDSSGKEAATADSTKDQKPAEPAADPSSNDANSGGGNAADSGGGGGNWPPHSVMGLPSLSPTMSQGVIMC